MNAFLTGSRVYGTPTPESDIDLVVLVVLVADGALGKLAAAASAIGDLGSPQGPWYEDGVSLRFGPLNLLCVTKQQHFDVWLKGTEELKSQAPVTREFAIQHLAALRKANKIEGW